MGNSDILLLKGAIQHYAWGGHVFIPQLLSIANPDAQPFAELWMGTHQRGPALVVEETGSTPLETILQDHPDYLGPHFHHRFGTRLPYLFKVLDVQKMLSIQAHPSKAQAEAGFARENKAGIPIDAPHRNYKDDNHKPELMVAITDFWLLHGFRQPEEIQATLETVPAFRPLLPHFQSRQIRDLYQYLMELPQRTIDQLLQPLKESIEGQQFTKLQPAYWAQKAFVDFALPGGHYDRGIFSIYLFNLLHIPPGRGIYQPAGIPHAYLEGVNMEIMANSDNVFRGGLTQKHVDVPELLKSLVFDSITPNILEGQPISEVETHYPTPAEEFGLSRITLNAGQSFIHTSQSPEIVILLSGSITLRNRPTLSTGAIFFIPYGTEYQLLAARDSTLFRAFVP